MSIKFLKHILVTSLYALFIIGCATPEGFKEPEDPLDAGREFIRAVLDGDYKRASLYVLEDKEDKELYERYEEYIKKQPRKERLLLKSSSIIINKSENINDSVTIINFSNSHTNRPMDLKVVKSNNQWKVDFSYTFSGNLPIE